MFISPSKYPEWYWAFSSSHSAKARPWFCGSVSLVGHALRGAASKALFNASGPIGVTRCFGKWVSRAKTDRPHLRRLVAEIGPCDVGMVTRLDRLARSTRDL